MFGAFFIMNLILAVIINAFTEKLPEDTKEVKT